MIVMDEKIVGVWYLTTIPNYQDFMAGVREIVVDEKYELKYRFRYYKDDKAFDSEDKKNWYEGTCTGTRNYVILSIRSTVAQLKATIESSGTIYEVLNENGLAQFMRDFQDLPFVFMRKGEQLAQET